MLKKIVDPSKKFHVADDEMNMDDSLVLGTNEQNDKDQSAEACLN